MKDQRDATRTRPGEAQGQGQSLLAHFIELAGHVVGPQATESETTSLPSASGSPAIPSDTFDQLGQKVINFEDWSEYTQVSQVLAVTVESADDVVTLCNNAAAGSYKLRALGHAHNWSPLIYPSATRPAVLLVDTSKLNTMVAGPVDGQATFGVGTTLDAATGFLETLTNPGAAGADEAPGYSFLNMPTPGALTLGGILAVGGHGTSVPSKVQEPDLMGCLSNMIVAFKAVTTDPANPGSPYAIREFHRSDPDASAFLVHLGRAFITEVTLAAVPNYYLELTNLFPPMADVMADPTSPLPETALASLLDAHGRVEVIWFPFEDKAWVQCNTRLAEKPTEPLVPGPYNYEWMNKISQPDSDTLKAFLEEFPGATPGVLAVAAADAEISMKGTTLYGTARDLEIYLTDSTLRMIMLGYVLQLRRDQVQAAVSKFYFQLAQFLDDYRTQGHYPVNGAVEIRCTTVDRQADLNLPGARPPALAATHSVDSSNAALDTVLWVDVVTFPHTKSSERFFVELEKWLIDHWGADYPGQLRPEWSKGWAYTTKGPWTNTPLIKQWIPTLYNGATDGLTFDWAKATLAKYDSKDVFSNPFLDDLFS